MPNTETHCALDAYAEEFDYFAAECVDDNFIGLCRELFIDNHGKNESQLIDWDWIEAQLRRNIEYWREKC